MLSNFKSHEIVWDFANKRIPNTIELVSSDNKGRRILVQMVNGNEATDATGASLSLYWESGSSHYKGLDSFDRVHGSNGLFELEPTTSMLSNVGRLDARLHLVLSGGRTITSLPFKIDILKGVDEKAVQTSSSFSALDKALGVVADIDGLIGMSKSQYDNLNSKINTLGNDVRQVKGNQSSLSAIVNNTHSRRLGALESELAEVKKKLPELTRQGTPLTVATFNVQHKMVNYEKYKEFMMVNRVDILGVQEMLTGDPDKAKVYNFDKVQHAEYKGDDPSNRSGYGTAVQSINSFKNTEVIPLRSSEKTWNRHLIKTTIHWFGHIVSVYNFHADSQSVNDWRFKQFEDIKNIMEADSNKYKILTGDFNVQNVDHYSRLGDLKSAQGFNGRYHETWNLSQGEWGTGAIDNVLVSPNIEIKKVVMHPDTMGSDHNLLMAELVLYD